MDGFHLANFLCAANKPEPVFGRKAFDSHACERFLELAYVLGVNGAVSPYGLLRIEHIEGHFGDDEQVWLRALPHVLALFDPFGGWCLFGTVGAVSFAALTLSRNLVRHFVWDWF
jgi:hypothetical protein